MKGCSERASLCVDRKASGGLLNELGVEAGEGGVEIVGEAGMRARCLYARAFYGCQPAETLFDRELSQRSVVAVPLGDMAH